ncbi:hypothetical protein DL96DRAFT_1522261 [Flagelloscypha sp. PMI_526]|nr:hypothetical protein DL96DRAFT_1522261 [Flagelloscypha sp. PMI_526]
MEGFQVHSAVYSQTVRPKPRNMGRRLAVGSMPSLTASVDASQDLIRDGKHTADEHALSAPTHSAPIHVASSCAIENSAAHGQSSASVREKLGQDNYRATACAEEGDNSNGNRKKESLPNYETHNAGHETKKILYIPVSDNIGEVDAGRLFSLLSQFESMRSNSGKSYNYEKKYPEDVPGQELCPDARVFKVCDEVAEEYDQDMIRELRDTLDSLLIFAALFSAVITTFVVQTAQALPTDQAAVTNHLLVDIAALIRTNGNATALAALPLTSFGPDASTFKTTDIWINGLFFPSLSLSLATALLSVLAKQWLQAYTTVISRSAKEIGLIRHLRFRGLQKWKMHEIIGALPLILHASLALLFAGLFIFVRTLYEGIAYVVFITGGLAYLCYLCSIILPAIDLQCPYRVTLYRPSKYIGCTAQCILPIFRQVGLSIAQAVAPHPFRQLKLQNNPWPTQPDSVHEGEIEAVSGDILTPDCLLRLRDLSSNITIRRIVAWTAAAIQDRGFML